MSKRNEALIRASGVYLTTNLTDDLIDGPEDELDAFIADHLWAPFECESANSVYSHISILADSFEELML